MNRLILVDGNAILHRAYHALPPLTTRNGKLVNAVFGFFSMLFRVIADLKPTHLAIAFDRAKPTFRKIIYVAYQAHRPKMDEGLSSQFGIVQELLTNMGIQIFGMDGYEADDVIGTIVNRIKGKKTEVIIVTGDRDMLQLINEKVRVYMPVAGISKSKMFGVREVEEKFGITPQQMIDYKALVGDPSDNYPGVNGIGPKTASVLLQKHRSLDKLYNDLKKIENDGVREKLTQYRESAKLAKQLATIHCDVPVDFLLDKCKLPNLDRPHIHQLLEKYEFRSLIPRLGSGKSEIRSAGWRTKSETKKGDKKLNSEDSDQINLF